MESVSKLAVYEFHGLTFSGKDEWQHTDCPFCGKENHFFASNKTAQFNCKVCGSIGNPYNFLKELWTASVKMNSAPKNAKRLQALADERGITLDSLQAMGFCISTITDEFLLPAFNLKGDLANLNRVVQVKDKWTVYGTKTCKQHPFGTKTFTGKEKTLWIAEGAWDAPSLRDALSRCRRTGDKWTLNREGSLSDNAVMGSPGAQNFQEEWSGHFKKFEVINVCYDNDYTKVNDATGKKTWPGWEGMQRVAKIAESIGFTGQLNILAWGGKDKFDPARPDGFDIRDLNANKQWAANLTILTSLLKPVDLSPKEEDEQVETVDPLKCESFIELCHEFARERHFTEGIRQTFAVAIATVVSTNMDGEQLFFKIKGPPSSGKTTIAEALSVAREYTYPKSILTGFHSGWTGGRGGKSKKSSSLIPKIHGKCVIVKDADTITKAASKDRVMSELRDIFDGASRTAYRNGVEQNFEEIAATFLLFGTDELDNLSKSLLGERFLDCDILAGNQSIDRAQYNEFAFRSAFSRVSNSFSQPAAVVDSAKKPLKQKTYGFLQYLMGRLESKSVKAPTCTREHEQRIVALAELLAYMRASVERIRDEMTCRTRVELAPRLVGQFTKLALVLCFVLGKTEVDDEIVGIVRQRMIDTARGYCYEIAVLIYNQGGEGISIGDLQQLLSLSETSVRRQIDDMLELKIIEFNTRPNRSGIGGRHIHLHILRPIIHDLFDITHRDLTEFTTAQKLAATRIGIRHIITNTLTELPPKREPLKRGPSVKPKALRRGPVKHG